MTSHNPPGTALQAKYILFLPGTSKKNASKTKKAELGNVVIPHLNRSHSRASAAFGSVTTGPGHSPLWKVSPLLVTVGPCNY